MSQVSDITFPEDNEISKVHKRAEIPPALKFITKLLYGSGTALSITYLLLLFIIQPLLEVQYERRLDFSSDVLSRTRALLEKLNGFSKLPTVVFKRGDKFYSDAQTQTKTIETKHSLVSFYDEEQTTNGSDDNILNTKLKLLRESLEGYNRYHSGIDEVNPLKFQIRNFQGRIDAYSQANLLRIRGQITGLSSTQQLKQDIRDIKGLFLTGQV
ncbi:Peroxisomal membrane protein PEX17 [Wickerhamomyces ciferrii]|uniref:Peroxisomal membrane protein PEX17 n=1 Tax=Wickerhamomyces ciferrii (strain ATCC 14091 / BCRC 22168 / CBS 111 / JCM 3599 / NBRC 0793 / NRRL Y-1031 F-60-10) TaxID=1206466 RepID=K0KI50_WICCF|nr:Peroxisomal membrane protein PEX17 [Wickerhamomyces ciferrii]CCH41837.1 Peroxisomal membrane protein PEX17 [Wickerhamomyces ciferrii]